MGDRVSRGERRRGGEGWERCRAADTLQKHTTHYGKGVDMWAIMVSTGGAGRGRDVGSVMS